MEAKKEKSYVVAQAEETFKYFNLTWNRTTKDLSKVRSRHSNFDKKVYTIPREITYHFTYTMNGITRKLEISRKAGNSQPLETNIRKALTKKFEEDLKNMQLNQFNHGE